MDCDPFRFTPQSEPVSKSALQCKGFMRWITTKKYSTTGNDGNSGTINSPVATISRANALASTGDTIYLRSGQYNPSRYIYVDKDGLTFSAYPGESASIVTNNSDASNFPYVFFLVGNNITLKNLEIKSGETYVLKIESNRNILISNCRIWNSGRDCIKTFNSDSLVIEKCNIGPSGLRDASNAEGIDSIGSVGVTIRDCYIHDTATNGLYLKGGARNGVIERNRVERSGHAGILLGQDTDEEFTRDNIVITANGPGIGTYSSSNIRFENNTLMDVAKQFHAGFYVVTNGREVPSRQISFKNNVVSVTGSRPMVFLINLSDNLVSNSNIWHRPNGGVYKFFIESPSRTCYWESFGEWQSGMNADSRSTVTDPRLDSANLCQPLSNSPTIDAGETINNAMDYSSSSRPQGGAFDIGAYERGGSGGTPPANQPPTVTVTATPTSGTAPLNVAFTSTARDPENQALTYSWNFGDSTSSTQGSPSHMYQAAGTYTARLTVTDAGGLTATTTVSINANAPGNRPPTVSVNPSATSVQEGTAVTFNTTASDPDGSVVSYSWDFGDGTTSNVASPSHAYTRAGSYTARVTVRDNGGATAGTQVTITVTPSDSYSEPIVNMVTPDGGETINGGSKYTIQWTATGTGLWRIDVAYSLDDGVTWIDIVNGPAGYSSLEWTVPNVKCKFAKTRVVVYGSRTTGQDQSRKRFTIVKPTLFTLRNNLMSNAIGSTREL
jgi:PKD repeat protein